jgi:hypothetical protein
MISQAEGPAEPNPAQISASKWKQAKIEESKTAFFCLRLFFVIDTFQWVRGESNKKSLLALGSLRRRPKPPVHLPPGRGWSVIRDDEWYSTNFDFDQHNASSVWFSHSAPPAIRLSVGDFTSTPR